MGNWPYDVSKSEYEIIDKKVQNLIPLLENTNMDGLRGLFAEAKIKKNTNFNNNHKDCNDNINEIFIIW